MAGAGIVAVGAGSVVAFLLWSLSGDEVSFDQVRYGKRCLGGWCC